MKIKIKINEKFIKKLMKIKIKINEKSIKKLMKNL